MSLDQASCWAIALAVLVAGCSEPSSGLLPGGLPPGLTIVEDALAPASTANDYEARITARNGTPPYRWSVPVGVLPEGLSLGASGTPSTLLSGRPQRAGTYSFAARVTDDVGEIDQATFMIEVQEELLPLSLVTTELPAGVVGQPYRFDMIATNGAPPYRWTLTNGPDGLSFSADTPGVLSGTPMQAGRFALDIQVEDTSGDRVIRSFTLTVQPAQPLQITTRAVAPADLNVTYNASIAATGGRFGAYQWTITQGSLPLGLSLVGGTPSADLTGTPEVAGVFPFTLQVQDGPEVADVQLELVVQGPLRIVTNSDGLIPLTNGQPQAPYSAVVGAENGVPPYAWSLNGQLPAGLSIAPTGTPQTRISGSPTESGTFIGTISVMDSAGALDVQPFSLVIASSLALDITTSSIPPATVCSAYAIEVASTGGVGPYQWSLVAGTLPSGLNLQPSATSDRITIAGTPVIGTAGSTTITLEVTDSLGATDTQVLTLTVIDSADDIPLAFLGDLEVDSRFDLYMADLCGSLPTPAVRVSSNTLVNRDLNFGVDDLALSPDGSKVAFIGDMDLALSTQVYVAEINGAVIGPPTRVSGAGWTADNGAFGLKFSPDGRRLAFVADGLINSATEIFVVDTSGPVVADSAVVINPVASHPGADVRSDAGGFQFSSDSERLIFSWDEPVDGQIEGWVADVTNLTARSAVRATTAVTGGDIRSHFQPVVGGARFVVAGDLITDDVTELFLIDASTLPPTTVRTSAPLTTNNADVLAGPRYFGVTPDGTTLWYFVRHLQEGVYNTNVFRADLANPGTATQLTGSAFINGQASQGDVLGAGPGLLVWGSSVGRPELFVFDLDGAPNQPLAAARVNAPLSAGAAVSSSGYAASPSGAWVSYAQGPPDKVMIVPMVGLQPQTAIQVSPPSPGAAEAQTTRVMFAPDERTVAYRARYSVAGQNDAYAVPLLGTVPGAWRRLTPNTAVGGDVSELFFASPNRLVMRGDIANDGDLNAFVVDISDPASLPVPITSQFIPTESDVNRVLIP